MDGVKNNKEMEDIVLLQGNCLEQLRKIPDNSIDMILTDPPYSSGGLFASDRKKSTRMKYTDVGYAGASRFPNFTGDNMDQKSYMLFLQIFLSACLSKVSDGNILMMFSDWRNIGAVIDAVQLGGWIYRGIVVWNKKNSRPVPGRFRNDCEYIVWATKGERKTKPVKGCHIFPGFYTVPIVQSKNKHHQTEKPLELLESVMAICPPGGRVLDAFMGSGSVGVACLNTGRKFTGIELNEYYFDNDL